MNSVKDKNDIFVEINIEENKEEIKKQVISSMIVSLSDDWLFCFNELKDILREHYIGHHKVRRKDFRACHRIQAIMRAFLDNPHLLPFEYGESINKYGLERTIADYIAGMTNRYAEKTHDDTL